MSAGGAFIGRVAQPATVAGELDAARSGRRCVLLVDGAAGIGKTALIRCSLVTRPGPLDEGGDDDG